MLNAAAIAEAVTKPTMRLVQIGQRKQSAHHPLHRIRDRYLSRRVSQYAMIHVAFGLQLGAWPLDSLPYALTENSEKSTGQRIDLICGIRSVHLE
jgi:hypothetical protein